VGAMSGNGTIRTSAAEQDTLTISGSMTASADYSGEIENGSGTVTVIRSGTGTVVFSGNNSFTGSLRITGGTLVGAHANALGLDTVYLAGGTLRGRSNSNLNFNRPCVATANTTIVADRETSGSGVTYTFGTLRINTAITLNLQAGSNVNSNTAGITFGNMTYAAAPTFTVTQPTLGGNTLFNFGAVSGAFTATFNGNGDAQQNGRYETGGGGITYSGTGNLFLNRQNTFTGALTINSGNVVGADSTLALGSGGISMNGSSRLTLLGDATTSFSRSITYNGNVQILLDRKTPGAGVTHTMGTLTCTSGNLTVLNGANNTSGTAIVVFSGNSTLNAATVFDVAANAQLQIDFGTANQSFTKNGAGELSIVGDVTTRDGSVTLTTLNEGRLTLSAVNALANSDTAQIIMNGGVLDLLRENINYNIRATVNDTSTIAVNRLTSGAASSCGIRAMTINNAELTVVNGSNVTSGNSTLNILGNLNLSGNAAYNTGATVNNVSGIITGLGSFTKNGSFPLNQNSSNAMTYSGSLSLLQGTLELLSNNGTVTGSTTLTGGSLSLLGNAYTLGGGVTVNSGTFLTNTNTTVNITDNFLQTGGTVTPGTSSTINVSGNFTRNGGTYTTNGTLRMNGTTQMISGTLDPVTIGNLVIVTGSTTTLAQNIRPTLASVTVQTDATLNASTFTLNRSAAGGILTIAGTLRLSGNTGGVTGSNFPSSYTTQTLTNSTIVYERLTGGQTINSAVTYTNIVLGNTSGTQTVGGNITINGTLTT
ncbi:MAG: beta strand repeat-containing protein, partial [Bacteroidota bacterium]